MNSQQPILRKGAKTGKANALSDDYKLIIPCKVSLI